MLHSIRWGLSSLVLALPVGQVLSAEPEAASPACALAAELTATDMTGAAVDVPFRTIEGRIYLDVLVDGKGPFVFAVDTGASGVGRIDASLVAALGLPPGESSQTSDGVATAKVDTVRLSSLTLAGLAHQDITLIARDYRSRVSEAAAFSGILGRGFFADGLLVIDFPAKRLRYFTGRALAAGQPGALAYDRAFRVPVTLGSMATTANLDTGADVMVMMPTALYDQLGGTPLQPAGNVSLTNSRIPSFSGRLASPLRLGDATLEAATVRVAEAYPEVLVGAQALAGQRVLIDQRHQTVAVCPAGAA